MTFVASCHIGPWPLEWFWDMCVCIIVKEPGADMVVIETIISKNNTTPAGFEPARAEPKR